MTILTFDSAIERSEDKRHLLLGNGFSIALKPDIFTYTSLYEKANFSEVPYARQLFDALGTKDFEMVIRLLMDMAKVVSLYRDSDPDLVRKIKEDANKIKKILVDTIASKHPDRPNSISTDQFIACRAFLKNFDRIYTLNYDVLLYWALMNEDVDCLGIWLDDGFRSPEDNADTPYVSWQAPNQAKVHYLHGALHLFDAGTEITKYTWVRTDIAIIDQIRTALDDDKYPIFVAEGDSNSKKRRIMHNAYLHKALRSLGSISGSIFIYGHSLADNDLHIFKEIIRNHKIKSIFISLYGDPASSNNQEIQNKATLFSTRRRESSPRHPLDVQFYDAPSAHVWG